MTRLRRPLALACGLLAIAALIVGAWSAAQFRAAAIERLAAIERPVPPVPLAWFGARPLLPITATLLGALSGLVLCIALARRPGGAT